VNFEVIGLSVLTASETANDKLIDLLQGVPFRVKQSHPARLFAMHNSSQTYRPPALPTYAQRKAEKERQLAIAAGQLAGTQEDEGHRSNDNGLHQAVDNGSFDGR
jgi:hypothetical protein